MSMQLPEKDLVRIFEATRAIASTLRLSELLETVMRLASEVVRSETGSLLLMDQPQANSILTSRWEKERSAPADSA